MSNLIRRGFVLAALFMAVPAIARAAETTVKAVSACCGGHCPFGW
jgi:hypothetical protein